MPTSLTNAFGTVTAVLTFLSGLFVSLGCSPGALDFAATCAIPWLPSAWLPYAAMVFGALTFILKLARPGGILHSLFGGTAVIVAAGKATVGTVSPAQVASGK